MFISVVLTTKNEGRHIRDLLDSLVVQEPPFEVIVVDSDSEDSTPQIVKRYAEKYDNVKLYLKAGTRAESMEYGVEKAKGNVIAFIGGDCIANPFWLKEVRNSLQQGEIAAGKTIHIGPHAFEDLERIELYHKGYDVTYPGCNTAYKREVLDKVGGLDPWFITAEDIDLNYRAVSAGYKIFYNENAIMYHRTRGSLYGFFKQAFWNGVGRKQLTLKHGRLWGSYQPLEMIKREMNFWSLSRLIAAMLGYIAYKLFGDRRYGK